MPRCMVPLERGIGSGYLQFVAHIPDSSTTSRWQRSRMRHVGERAQDGVWARSGAGETDKLGRCSLCFIVDSVSILFVYAIYTEQVFPATPLVNTAIFKSFSVRRKRKN
jgi:hypothetical protein